MTTITTILGILFTGLLLLAVAGGLIALIYFLASTRVAEAEERQRAILKSRTRTSAAPSE